MTATGRRWTVHVLMVGVILAWSGAFAMIKIALREITPFDLTLLRFLVACVPLAVVLAFTGLPRFSRDEWPRVLLVSFLAVGGYHLALNYGETAVSAGVAALIVATGPIWTALVSAAVLKERVTRRKVAGIALALAGVVVLVLGQDAGLSVTYVVGALIALLAPMMWAFSSVASKPLLARHSPLLFTAVTTLIGTVPLLAIASSGTTERAAAAGGWTWIAVLHLGLAATVFGYIGFNYALRQLSPTETMAYVYLNPLFAVGWAWTLTREPLHVALLGGGLLVVAGVAVTNWPTRTARAPQAAAAASAPRGRE